MDLFRGEWTFMRIVRLGIGVALLAQAFFTKDYVPGFFALFFLYQAATNTGCCGSAGCRVPKTGGSVPSNDSSGIEEIN